MTKAIISTPHAPAAIGPYSQAVRAGDFVFCSGQIPLDPATGNIVEGDVRAQTERVMNNLQAVLEAAGAGLDRIVKTTIFLVDLGDFGVVNETYARFFPGDPPARACVEVSKLPRGVRVEIEATAYLGA
jgi:2-iminobutanoate/2-iminopropanoate deaminase